MSPCDCKMGGAQTLVLLTMKYVRRQSHDGGNNWCLPHSMSLVQVKEDWLEEALTKKHVFWVTDTCRGRSWGHRVCRAGRMLQWRSDGQRPCQWRRWRNHCHGPGLMACGTLCFNFHPLFFYFLLTGSSFSFISSKLSFVLSQGLHIAVSLCPLMFSIFKHICTPEYWHFLWFSRAW